MTAHRILVKEGRVRSGSAPTPERAWSVLGVMGIAFAIVALVDLLLTWVPMQFGNVEWGFGTVTATFSNLPLLTMGLALAMGSAGARDAKGRLTVLSVLMLVIAVLLVAAAVLYLTSVGAARQAVTDPILRLGLRNAVIKTLVQSVAYPVAYAWLGVVGLRHARTL